jgi:hypothetical protein
MKTIQLKTVQATEGGAALVYADAIRTVIRQPLDTNRGVYIDEMRKGIRILDKLDEAEASNRGKLELEDADYEHLKLKIEAMAWGMVDRHLLEFIDMVLAASASPNGIVQPPVPARA